MGSKARFAKDIYECIVNMQPTGRDSRPWVEPFAGGMNMICEVPGEEGPRYANDINKFLISCFRHISRGWIPPAHISLDLYLRCKALDPSLPDYVIGYVGINSSYSGKWFGGYAGITKTRTGIIRDYQAEALRNVLKQVPKLEGIKYCSKPYEQLIYPHNSIIYCDPPYAGTTKYSSDFDSLKFWSWVRMMSKKHTVYVSEYAAPRDFKCIWMHKACSSLRLNSRSEKNVAKTSVEKLFVIKP